MARPRKLEEEKRAKRLTVYFTENESSALDDYAAAIDTDKAKIVVKAVMNHIDKVADIPEPVRVNRSSTIARDGYCSIRGYVCEYGHAFFIPFDTTSSAVAYHK
jgi:hypothetical protein